MTRLAVVAGGDLELLPTAYDGYIGVDAGCLALLDNGLPLDMAIGDFDSISKEELARVQAQARLFIQAPAEKDDTDLELALKEVFQRYPEAQVTIYGAFGGRLDHMMANLFLASEPALAPFMRQIELVDKLNLVRFYPAGQHRLLPQKDMTYVSFMPEGGGRLSIWGAKYPLDEAHYFLKKCYASNEFIGREMNIGLDKGYVIVIYSKDRR